MLQYIKRSAYIVRQRPNRFRYILAVASILMLGGGLVAGASAWSAHRTGRSPNVAPVIRAAQSEPPTEQRSDPSSSIEVLRVTIRPTGFEPSEINHTNKSFYFAIDNQSGLDNVQLKLEREVGNSSRYVEHVFELPTGRLRGGAMKSLPPGQYLLTEAQHPEWVCRITISPRS